MAGNLTDDDVDECKNLLGRMDKDIHEASVYVDDVVSKIKAEMENFKGISFLEMKNHLLLSYLNNICSVILRKLNGESLNADSTILRIAELRTIMEKIRPIDQKLQYQIDKIVRVAHSGATDANDPLRYKANPLNLVNDDEDDDSEAEEVTSKKKTQLYRPPKLAKAHFDESKPQERVEQQEKQQLKRALQSSLMRELQEEHSDAPREIKETADLHRARMDRSGKERTEYEETYMTRMTLSKKDLAEQRRLRTMGGLDGIVNFGDTKALLGGSGSAPSNHRKRKKQVAKKKPGKKRRHK